MNIASDVTTKMVPQKSIKVSIELTEEETIAFIGHYGTYGSCLDAIHPVTRALFDELNKALVKPPVDDAAVVVTNTPRRPYPTGTRVTVRSAVKPWIGKVVGYDRLHCWYEVKDENGGIGAYDPQDIEAI
jgi:hypothetical protein